MKKDSLEKVGDVYRLRESLSINKDTIIKKHELKEKLTESVLGRDLPVYGTYTIKLWAQESFNRNGRNYRNVFSKILNENKVTIGFMDHPNDSKDESYKNVVLVCKNPSIQFIDGENWLCVDVTLIGKPYGENCEAILEAGGFLEFSSSALGDVDNDGYVLEDGFFLERYADIVVNSSNAQLYFKSKEEPREIPQLSDDNTLYDIKNEKNEKTEKVETKEINIDKNENNNLTILKSDTLSEKTGEKTMSDKLSEKSLELNIKSMVKDADAVSILSEKKQILETALSYAKELSDGSLAESIESKIDLINTEVHTLAEKAKEIEPLQESVKSITEAKELVEKELEALKEEKKILEENYNNIVTLYESKQFEASQTELATNKKLKEEVSTLTESVSELKEKAKKLLKEKEYFEALSNTMIEADKYVQSQETIKQLKEENESLKEKVRELRVKTMKEKTIQVQPKVELRKEPKEQKVQESSKASYDEDTLIERLISERGLI